MSQCSEEEQEEYEEKIKSKMELLELQEDLGKVMEASKGFDLETKLKERGQRKVRKMNTK